MCRQFCIEDDNIFEDAWKELLLYKYRENDNILKVIGTNSWRTGFSLLSWRKRMPKGVYTSKHNIVFGHGKSACESWLLIAHTANTRIHTNNTTNTTGNGQNYIELRLCLQNIDLDECYINLDRINIQVYTRNQEHTDDTDTPLIANKAYNTNIIAYNGNKYITDSNIKSNIPNIIKLLQYQFIVVSFRVPIYADLEHEVREYDIYIYVI